MSGLGKLARGEVVDEPVHAVATEDKMEVDEGLRPEEAATAAVQGQQPSSRPGSSAGGGGGKGKKKKGKR